MMEFIIKLAEIYGLICMFLGAVLAPALFGIICNLRHKHYRQRATLLGRLKTSYNMLFKKEYGSMLIIYMKNSEVEKFHKLETINIGLDRINMTEYEKIKIMKIYVNRLNENQKEFIEHSENVASLLSKSEIKYRL